MGEQESFEEEEICRVLFSVWVIRFTTINKVMSLSKKSSLIVTESDYHCEREITRSLNRGSRGVPGHPWSR